MDQVRTVAEAGADLVRVAVPRDKDAEALRTIVRDSPIPVIADIHFNHTLALKAIDAGAHCIRLNPGNIGGREKVAEVAEKATKAGVPMRIGVNSGSLPKHLHELERDQPVEALVAAAVEFVELMESLEFTDFKVSIKSTNVPNTIAANRLLSERIDYPLHLGITEAGTKWSGSLKSAVGLGTLLADGVGDTIRISLSTFHAEEEVKVAWEILKALGLRERGPVLIACPTCGRLQFDMDTVVAEIEDRLEAYEDPIEVAVLGCAVNGIGEASHADFGITGAKNEGLIFAHGEPLRKVKQDDLVDELFAEIDKSVQRGGEVVSDDAEQGRGRRVAAEDRGGERGRPHARADRGHGGRGREGRRRHHGAAAGAGRGGVAHGGPALHADLATRYSSLQQLVRIDRPQDGVVALGPELQCRDGHRRTVQRGAPDSFAEGPIAEVRLQALRPGTRPADRRRGPARTSRPSRSRSGGAAPLADAGGRVASATVGRRADGDAIRSNRRRRSGVRPSRRGSTEQHRAGGPVMRAGRHDPGVATHDLGRHHRDAAEIRAGGVHRQERLRAMAAEPSGRAPELAPGRGEHGGCVRSSASARSARPWASPASRRL